MMKKQVQILVIGNTEKAVPEFLRRQEGHHQFSYCARDNYANDLNNQSGRCYDWIVIDGESLGGGETELIQSLRAMGFFLQQNGDQEKHRCGVEWSQEGVLQLRCCMQVSRNESRLAVHQVQDEQQNGFVFEFHAPVKRTG
jgi:hypothetical protein